MTLSFLYIINIFQPGVFYWIESGFLFLASKLASLIVGPYSHSALQMSKVGMGSVHYFIQYVCRASLLVKAILQKKSIKNVILEVAFRRKKNVWVEAQSVSL